MLGRVSATSLLTIAILTAGATEAHAQHYPIRPIRLIVSGVGGSADFVARMIAQGISPALEQPVVVENRASSITSETVAKSPPDGYTLLLASPSHWLLPLMRAHVNYDPAKDFTPITVATMSPNVLVVYPALPVRSVKELIALGKAQPSGLNYATTGTGTSNHMAAELFRVMTGIEMVRVNYKATSGALNDLMSGQLQVSFHTVTSVAPYMSSGRLRALGVTSAERSMAFPELPTVAATGLPGYESVSTLCIFAPAGLPVSVVNRLNQEIVRFLNLADTKARLLKTGAEVVASSPEQLMGTMKRDMSRMGKVIKDAGMRDE